MSWLASLALPELGTARPQLVFVFVAGVSKVVAVAIVSDVFLLLYSFRDGIVFLALLFFILFLLWQMFQKFSCCYFFCVGGWDWFVLWSLSNSNPSLLSKD